MIKCKLKTTALLIGIALFANNAAAKITDLGDNRITGSGVLDNGGIYQGIGVVGENNTISIENNGSVTINFDGDSFSVPIPSDISQVHPGYTQNLAVQITHGGTLNLGSGSTINVEHNLYPLSGTNTGFAAALSIATNFVTPGGTVPITTSGMGKLIADNLTININNTRNDIEYVVALDGDQEDAFFNLTGVTSLNATTSGANGNAVGVYAKRGTHFSAEDLLVNSTGTFYAAGIYSQAGTDGTPIDKVKPANVQYQNAVINVTADDYVDGISADGGIVEAMGDTTINATINQAGGLISGIWLSNNSWLSGLDMASQITSHGKAQLLMKAGADGTQLHAVESMGSSQFTANQLSVLMDTQGHQQTEGIGLYAGKNTTAATAGKITLNGALDIDVADDSRSGNWRYIHAENGGEITLNGGTRLGVGYNDPDVTAILASNAGTRVIANAQKLEIIGTIEASDAGVIDLSANNASHITGGFTTESGATSNLALSESSVWNMTKDSQLTDLTLSDATLNFMYENGLARRATRSSGTFKTLTVMGDYQGNEGHIVMNTALGDDSSPTDRLIIEGSTHGTTNVTVVNAGGAGAQTTNGIELITVNGTSDGEFRQTGRIVAGAYDYTLRRGNGLDAANWYLSNLLPSEAPVQPEPIPEEGESAIRPEAGLYAVNLAAANALFNTRLHDRLGETHYVDAVTGEEAVTSLWLRNVGGHTRQRDDSGQLNMQSNRYVAQLGGDLAQWSSNHADRFHMGLMAGYANQSSHAKNKRNGNRADGHINGYSVGIYGTWLQDNDTLEGAYVDTWAQYNWFNNTVSSDAIDEEKYKSKGFTASVESGYTWKLADISERNALYIQPKAQLTWMGVRADDHKEANGTRVEGKGDGNLQSRVGVRLYGHGHNKLDADKDRNFQPFVEVNWIHNSKNFGASLSSQDVNLAGSRNIGEVKAGVEGQLTKNVTLWGNVAQQVGDKDYSDTSAMLGIKASF